MNANQSGNPYGAPQQPGNQYGRAPQPGNQYGRAPQPGNQYGRAPRFGNQFGVPPQFGNAYGGAPQPGNQPPAPANKKLIITVVICAVLIVLALIIGLVLFAGNRSDSSPAGNKEFVFSTYEEELDKLDDQYAEKGGKFLKAKRLEALQADYDYLMARNELTPIFARIYIDEANNEVVCVLPNGEVYHHRLEDDSYIEDDGGEVIETEKDEEEAEEKPENHTAEELTPDTEKPLMEKLLADKWIVIEKQSNYESHITYEFFDDGTANGVYKMNNEPTEFRLNYKKGSDDSYGRESIMLWDDVGMEYGSIYNTGSDKLLEMSISNNGQYVLYRASVEPFETTSVSDSFSELEGKQAQSKLFDDDMIVEIDGSDCNIKIGSYTYYGKPVSDNIMWFSGNNFRGWEMEDSDSSIDFWLEDLGDNRYYMLVYNYETSDYGDHLARTGWQKGSEDIVTFE